MIDLPTLWFVIIGVLLAGYAVLDGFDLGVGILHPLASTDEERKIFLNSIGPIWDGNEVWLVVFGGALFAAFPEAYATAFSAFYTPLYLLLLALIFRAVSIEFRSKRSSKLWHGLWDWAFFSASFLASFVFGVAVGVSILGLPLNERGVFVGTLLDLFQPYGLLVGFLTVAMFAMHGSVYLTLRLPLGELHTRVKSWVLHTWGIFLVLYLLATIETLVTIPHVLPKHENFYKCAPLVVLNILALANIPRATYKNKMGQAFISSSVTIVCLVGLFGIALWPNLIGSSTGLGSGLNIYQAASSPKTLKIMLLIAMIGMPLVLAYTAIVYWTFRRRVEIGKLHY